MAYRVDNIPWWLKPFFWLWAYAIAIVFVMIIKTLRFFTRKSVNVKGDTLPDVAIYAIWHEDLMLYFLAEGRYHRPFYWMNHPLWYMKPVHILLNWKGVSGIALGSSGHGGQDAMEKVIDKLKEGYSTFLAIDGPAGPAKKAKIGAIKMSAQTGIPIIPITFRTSNEWRNSGWDRKRIPHFFSRWLASYGKPIYAHPDDLGASKRELEKALSNIAPNK